MSLKEWRLKSFDQHQAEAISKEFNLPVFLAVLLEVRSIKASNEINDFLSEECTLADPFSIKDMDKAVDRIKKATEAFQKICIYGDYDADGVTATALLYSYLAKIGANVIYYIPRRESGGYGLNNSAIKSLKEQQVNLIITVDNGISAVNEIAFANSLNIDIIVTDHHRPPENLPDAVAIVDPHQHECPSTFKDFSGVGLAFKLIIALENNTKNAQAIIDDYIDLVTIGTIADVVPLTGENRMLVKQGIKSIYNPKRPGLRAAMDEACLLGKDLKSLDLAFTLCPRFNACGRLSSSEKVVKLLTSNDPEETGFLAQELGKLNQSRKSIENEILSQTEVFINQRRSCLFQEVIIIWGKGWHAGVIGIVAARLVEKYGKPCIIIAINGQDARGSGRSIEGFPLHQAVSSCAQHLKKFGGHPMAVGFEIEPEKIPVFCQAMFQFAKKNNGVLFPILNLDCKLNAASLSIDLIKQLDMLEPFGCENPEPIFGMFNTTLKKICPVGGGNHLRLHLKKDEKEITAMKFHTKLEEFGYIEGDTIDIAFTLKISEYMGQPRLSVFIKDIRFSASDVKKLLAEKKIYEAIRRGETSLEFSRDLLPERSEFAVVYRYLKSRDASYKFPPEFLYFRLQSSQISFCKLLLIIDIMEELGLIKVKIKNGTPNIQIQKTDKRIDIAASKIMRDIKALS